MRRSDEETQPKPAAETTGQVRLRKTKTSKRVVGVAAAVTRRVVSRSSPVPRSTPGYVGPKQREQKQNSPNHGSKKLKARRET